MSTRLYFLGLPHFERDGQPVEFSAAKAVALLAYLSATHTPQPRDRILGLLWAESANEAARKNLRNTLWTIRKVLGEDVVNAEGNRLSLTEAVWVDVHAFETGIATLSEQEPIFALYCGPFLDGLTLTEAPNFEMWLTAERERLSLLYSSWLGRQIELCRSAGKWSVVIPLAQRALQHDVLQEPMHRALMEAYARLDERSEALRQYERLRAILASELGVEPLPETQALHTAIANSQLQPIPSSALRPERRQPILGDTPRVPFVGRQVERAALDAEFRTAADNRARIVLLSGELGIGKSRLWQEWAASLPPEYIVLQTRCLVSTQTLPFAPLNELFGNRMCAKRLFSGDTQVLPIWLTEIARLFPDLRAELPDLPAPSVLPPEEERQHLFEAFTQWLSALKGQPLVLFIDDLQWADPSLLDWLDYVVHRLYDQPLLLVGTYRPDDAPTRLIHLVAGWSREGIARRLPLERLTPQESLELIETLDGDPALVEPIQQQSAGNPYFLIELYRAAPGNIPPTLAELVTLRLERLPDSARQILQAAVILEPDFDFNTLGRVSGRSEDETLDALDQLLARDVLVERSGQYTFSHPLVATVVRDALSSARRSVLHRRAAAAREAKYAGRLPLIAGRLAAHYQHADDPIKAAHYAEMAAEHALTLAAPTEAKGFYEQALALDPTPARWMGLGGVLYWQGDLSGTQAAFTTALQGFEAQADRHGMVDACLSIAETYLPAGHGDKIERWVVRALTILNDDPDPESQARAHFLLGTGKIASEHALTEAESHLLTAARLATDNNLLGIAARSRFELGNLLAERGELAAALSAYQETIALAHKTGDRVQEVLGHNNVAYHALLSGDLSMARDHVEQGLNLAEAFALRIPLQYLYSTRGEIALAEKNWTEAENWFNRGLREAEHNGNLKQAANYHANLGLTMRGSGDLDAALIWLEMARDGANPLAAPHLQTQIDLWLTELHIQRGETAAANEALTRSERRLTSSDRQHLRARAVSLRGLLS